MNSDIAVKGALGVIAGAVLIFALNWPWRKPSGGWSPVPPAGTYLTTEPSPASPTFEELCARHGAVVGNMIVPSSQTLIFPGVATITADGIITIPGHHVITQAEAEEVVKALDSYAAMWEVLADVATSDGRTQSAERCRAYEAHAKATLAKWRKRVEEGKP